jgi:glycogen debranching enzyme
VEVQALWLNALAFGATFSDTWAAHCDQGITAFDERFWNADTGALFDVLDVDHRPGVNDPALRPNQIFAIGGLPLVLLEGERARRVVDVVEGHLLTPLGMRTLAPGSVGYVGHYEGGVQQRDGSYHQGTAWPWLTCAFVEAWLRVHGSTDETRAEALTRFLAPLREHLHVAGLGHVSEIADADRPHTPRGCPFQAWSLGELIRLEGLLK